MLGFSELRFALTSVLTRVEIEVDGVTVRAYDTASVPATRECINWGSRYKVQVLEREWVLDTDTVNPQGKPRCVLTCQKLVWPK